MIKYPKISLSFRPWLLRVIFNYRLIVIQIPEKHLFHN